MSLDAHQALIVTFYAFKGGTGRTLALANVARLLCDEAGYRVGLMDLDIDSPGLVHEALCRELELEPDGAVGDAIDACPGFLELFVARGAPGAPNAIDPEIIDRHVCALPGPGNGNLILMPTAQRSKSQSPDFLEKVERFTQAFAETGVTTRSAAEITWEIAGRFIERFQLDFLFIDGRTGAGPFSPVYTYSIPHLLVLFFGLNDQNITGSLSVLDKSVDTSEQPPSPPVPVFLVASPVPTVGPAALEKRLAVVAGALKKRRSQDRKSLYDLPRQVDHLLYYSDAAAFGEAYFPGQYPHSLLAQGYRKLASDIEKLVIKSGDPVAGAAHARRPAATIRVSATAPQLRVAFENVHADLLENEFRHFGSGRIESISCPAEQSDAPWMTVANGADAPDIVMVPHSRLKELSAFGKDVADRDDENGPFHSVPVDRESSSLALDPEFLEQHYKNWRKRCTINSKIVALPFSVNASILCANMDLLQDYCAAYWHSRGQRNGSVFIPSNWQSLSHLIEVNQNLGVDPARIFSMVSEGPGLYYEWLNFVISLGGYDVLLSDGHLDGVGFIRPETRDATRRFIDLARLTKCSATMADQIGRFASQQCALYMGWTDSFRFERDKGVLTGLRPTTLTGKSPAPAGPPPTIRLAASPRDMRQQRTCLVDGWVMTFPRRNKETRPSDASLLFARWFLEPKRQRELLKRGFPSPSSWAVDRELESFRADNKRPARVADGAALGLRLAASYEVYLTTMQTAIHGGRWAASPQARIDTLVARALSRLTDQATDVESTLADLQHTVVEGLKDNVE